MLDQGVLQDSLLNLILNARDAMAGKTGQIALGVATVADTWLELTLTDTGSGFSDEALHKALDPFFTTKGAEGSGLGLAMVYDQITLSGGTVRLANRPQGGAQVTLRLPYKPVRPARNMPRAGLVLLVEDTQSIREAVRVMLCDMGHSVIEATTADEALALADLPDLDIMLSDINLPGTLSGLDLARALRGRGHIRICLMTALPPYDKLHLEAANEFRVLTKPFGPQDLRFTLEGLA